MRYLKFVKPATIAGFRVISGAGGNRTRVQTPVEKAFYMLIPLLFVGNGQGSGKPNRYLAVWSFATVTAFRSSILYLFVSRRRSLVTEQPAQRGPND